jgi:hypothetical protein
MEVASEFIEDEFEADLRKHLETATYPRFGYTTAQVFENEEEYEQFLREDFQEQLADWLDFPEDETTYTVQATSDTNYIEANS